MAVFFLFFASYDSPAPFDWQTQMTRADQVVGMFGWRLIIVEPRNLIPVSRDDNPMVVRSLDQAIARADLAGMQWVWLHPQGTQLLQDFAHPADNVVYCVGHDDTGFSKQMNQLQGDVLRIWGPDPNREFFADTAMHIVVYDRVVKLQLWKL